MYKLRNEIYGVRNIYRGGNVKDAYHIIFDTEFGNFLKNKSTSSNIFGKLGELISKKDSTTPAQLPLLFNFEDATRLCQKIMSVVDAKGTYSNSKTHYIFGLIDDSLL